ncbi:MAG: hypothetical protein WCI66_10260 [Gammaproteobacteria bacterium]
MVNVKLCVWLATLTLLLSGIASSNAQPVHYDQGSVISEAVFVTDKDGSRVSLRSLLTQQPSQVNVVFIFGGGDLGTGLPGHLWCPDSFEDTHILRTLVGKYAGKPVKFIAVASAPVYHSQTLGQPAQVFLDAADDSTEFKTATAAFISSTLAAQQSGILPIAPYFDLRLRLMLNPASRLQPGAGFGERADWQGAFRAEAETQFYGVPGFWLISDSGTVLAKPFRGNVYHPHGAEVHINYTFSDVDAAIQALLH